MEKIEQDFIYVDLKTYNKILEQMKEFGGCVFDTRGFEPFIIEGQLHDNLKISTSETL